MNTAIDHQNPLPLYHQLKRLIQKRIESGDLKPGDVLPTDRDLEQQYSLSRITIRQALSDLAREGYITRGRGRPTAVAQPKFLDERIDWLGGFLAGFRSQGHATRTQVLDSQRASAPPKVAAVLGLRDGNQVLLTRRLIYVDNEPIAVVTDYLAAAPGVTIVPEEVERYVSVYDYLEARLGLRLVRGEKTLEAVIVNEEEARLLDMKTGAPVFLAQTIAFTEEGAPMLYIKASYRGDRYKYHVALRRQPSGSI